MTKNRLAGILSVVLAAALLIAATAPRGKTQSGNPMERLGLTPDQQHDFLRQRVDALKDIAPLAAELAVKQAEMETLWLADSPVEDQIVAKTREISALRQQIREKRIHQRLEMMKKLTPEQRKLLQTMHPFGREDGNGLMGRWGRGRMGRMQGMPRGQVTKGQGS